MMSMATVTGASGSGCNSDGSGELTTLATLAPLTPLQSMEIPTPLQSLAPVVAPAPSTAITPPIMVFTPTWEEFQQFDRYIEFIESQGAFRAGLAKIIPPAEWVPCATDYNNLDLTVPMPVDQKVTGSQGHFQQIRTWKKPMHIQELEQLANSDDFCTPGYLSYDELEETYWQDMMNSNTIYPSADVDSSLCDQELKVWNLRKLNTMLDDLSEDYPDQDLSLPRLDFGMWKTTFPWHTEDLYLYGLSYLHFGAPRTWYCVPPDHRGDMERLAGSFFPTEQPSCPAFLRHKTVIISPKVVRSNNIPVLKMTQEPREIVVSFPCAYTAGFSHGFNCTETVNFATPRWIDYGKTYEQCVCTDDLVQFDMDIFVRKYQPQVYKKWKGQFIQAKEDAKRKWLSMKQREEDSEVDENRNTILQMKEKSPKDGNNNKGNENPANSNNSTTTDVAASSTGAAATVTSSAASRTSTIEPLTTGSRAHKDAYVKETKADLRAELHESDIRLHTHTLLPNDSHKRKPPPELLANRPGASATTTPTTAITNNDSKTMPLPDKDCGAESDYDGDDDSDVESVGASVPMYDDEYMDAATMEFVKQESGAEDTDDDGVVTIGRVKKEIRKRERVQGDHVCIPCNKVFLAAADLNEHIKDQHKQKCSICAATFKYKLHLKIHLRGHEERAFHCPKCPKQFMYQENLDIHIQIHKPGPLPFRCDQCGSSFLRKQELVVHNMKHTGERPFKCSVCPSAFRELSKLRIHNLIHSGLKPHVCSICSKAFQRSEALKQHFTTHTGEKLYKCNTCGREFGHYSGFKIHRRVHTGEKCYKCDICNSAFRHLATMKTHRMIHTGETPHKCPICNKGFRSTSEVKQHLKSRVAHLKKLWKCVACGKRMREERVLRNHIKLHARALREKAEKHIYETPESDVEETPNTPQHVNDNIKKLKQTSQALSAPANLEAQRSTRAALLDEVESAATPKSTKNGKTNRKSKKSPSAKRTLHMPDTPCATGVDTPVVVKKRRGRPPKRKSEVLNNSNVSPSIATPSKQRPAAENTSFTDENDNGSAANDASATNHKQKRGRKQKTPVSTAKAKTTKAGRDKSPVLIVNNNKKSKKVNREVTATPDKQRTPEGSGAVSSAASASNRDTATTVAALTNGETNCSKGSNGGYVKEISPSKQKASRKSAKPTKRVAKKSRVSDAAAMITGDDVKADATTSDVQ